jgi:hypothetical protein
MRGQIPVEIGHAGVVVNFREKYMRRGCMEKGDGRVVMPQITVRRRISLD